MVLGMVAKVPVFPIVYSNKTRNVLDDINFEGNYADLRDKESLTYENAKYNLEMNYKVNIDEMKKNADQHFMKLDKMLK